MAVSASIYPKPGIRRHCRIRRAYHMGSAGLAPPPTPTRTSGIHTATFVDRHSLGDPNNRETKTGPGGIRDMQQVPTGVLAAKMMAAADRPGDPYTNKPCVSGVGGCPPRAMAVVAALCGHGAWAAAGRPPRCAQTAVCAKNRGWQACPPRAPWATHTAGFQNRTCKP